MAKQSFDSEDSAKVSSASFVTISTDSTSPFLPSRSNVSTLEGCIVPALPSLGFIPWDNPDNLVSQHTEKLFNLVVVAACLPLLFLISVPCNLLNMLVFWKQGLKERVNLCLFYLSLVDFLHMLNSFLYNVEQIRFPLALVNDFGPVTSFIVDHFLMGFVRGFSWLSGFASMLIACERCLCVVSPLRSQTFFKTKTTAVILLVASAIILCGVVMIGLKWSLICVYNPVTNTTSTSVSSSKFYRENKAHIDVLTFFFATLQRLFYVIVVTITTIVTSVKLKLMMAWREQSSSSTLSAREISLTRMLITVSVLYIMCSLPPVIAGVSVMFVPGVDFSGRYHNFLNLLASMMDLGAALNATVNFFVYVSMGSRFRETLWGLLCCQRDPGKLQHK